MVITEIRNRHEAESFIELLKNTSISNSTERPFSAHFFFFTTGLEIEESKLILESIVELDKVSGSYIACHLFVDKLKTSIFETLSGIYERKPIEGRDFTLKQIEGLCNNESLNHIELGELEPSDLTNATEHIARGLGISDKLPCILIFDSTEMLNSDKITIIEFPDSRKDLSNILRKFLGLIQANKESFKKNTEILDEINDLFEKQKKIRTKRGAPLEIKLKILNQLFDKNFDSLQDGLKESQRVSKKIFNDNNSAKEQLGLVIQSKLVSWDNSQSSTIKQLRKELENTFGIEMETYIEGQEGNSGQIQKLHDLLLQNFISKVKHESEKLDSELAEIDGRIDKLKSELDFTDSVSKIFRKDRLMSKYTETVKTSMTDIIKAGIKELGKPSFWLEIFGP